MTLSLKAIKGQTSLGGSGGIVGDGEIPLIHVGSFQASFDTPVAGGGGAMLWPNNGVGRWVEALSNGKFVMPFHYRWASGLPLFGDGSAPTPPTTCVYNLGATSVSSYATASSLCIAQATSAVISEVMAYAENYSAGRKGFAILRLFDSSSASGAGTYSYATEVSAATACINKVIANGWIPVVLTPLSNASTSATQLAAGQTRYRQLFDWVMSLPGRFPGIVAVDASTPLHTQTPPWSGFFNASAAVGTTTQIADTVAVQLLQNLSTAQGSSSTNLFQINQDNLTPAGAIIQARCIWEKLVSMGYMSDVPPKPTGWIEDRSVWGSLATGYGNPLMYGATAVTASGTQLAGTVAANWLVNAPGANGLTALTNAPNTGSGITPSVGRDAFGRNYMRADINYSWASGGHNANAVPLGFQATNATLSPDTPSPGTWLQARARVRVGDTSNNATTLRFVLDVFGSLAVSAGFQQSTNDFPYLPLLRGQELYLRTTPYRWGTGNKTIAVQNDLNAGMVRLIPSIGLGGAAGALSLQGQLDLYECTVNYLSDSTDALYY